jgi:hypothetical protein
MDSIQKELADLRAAHEQLQGQLTAANAKLAAAQTDQTIQAKDAQIAALQGTITELQNAVNNQKAASAKAVVDAAVVAGKLAPQAKDLHAAWCKAIESNPQIAETLNSLPVNAALGTVVAGWAAPSGIILGFALGLGWAAALELLGTLGSWGRPPPTLSEPPCPSDAPES